MAPILQFGQHDIAREDRSATGTFAVRGNIYQSESHVLSLQNYVRQSYDASSSVKKAPIQTRVPDAVESVGQLEVELLRSPLHELGTSGTSKWI